MAPDTRVPSEYPRAHGTLNGFPWALVVAASPALRAWITSQLHHELVVRDATCAAEAIAVLEAGAPDLVVADLSTLDVPAVGLLWQLRKLAPRAQRVLVVAPSTPSGRDVEVCREPGDVIVERPIAVDGFIQTLRDAAARVLVRDSLQVPRSVVARARRRNRDVACWLIDLADAAPFAGAADDLVLATAKRALALLSSEPPQILHDARRGTLRVLIVATDRTEQRHLARWSQELRLRLDLALLKLVTGTPARLPQTRVAVHLVRTQTS